MRNKREAEFPHGSRPPARHAYDELLTRLARLASFAACPLLQELGAVEKRQDQLALDDIIIAAIHIRRLLEITGQQKALAARTMVAHREGRRELVPISTVINAIIHNRTIEILRREAQYLIPPTLEGGPDWGTWMAAFKKGREPVAVIQSDRVKYLIFRIDAFVAAIGKELLAPVVEHCDENGFYLENLDDD